MKASRAVRDLCALAAKMSIAQLAPVLAALYLGGLVARRSALAFSSYTLVNGINLTAFLSTSSLLQSLYFAAGGALGRGEREAYRRALLTGTFLALVLGAGCSLISAASGGGLALLGLDPRVVAGARGIGVVAATGIAPSMLLAVYRIHASLRRYAGLVTVLAASGSGAACTAATAALDRLTPAPESAPLLIVGTVALINWFMLLAAALSLRLLPALRLPTGEKPERWIDRANLLLILDVGWPIAAIVFLDCLVSLTSQLLVGRFWLDAIPVHGAVLLWTSMGLVAPLGLAQATAQQVALCDARGERDERNRVVLTAILLGLGYGVLALGLFAAASVQLGALVLGGASLAPASADLLRRVMPLGGAVLAMQGIVIVAAASLRGVGETRGPLGQAIIGYFGVAGLGQVVFAFALHLGVVGVWWGMAAGFGFIAAAVTRAAYLRFRDVPAEPAAPLAAADHGQTATPLGLTTLHRTGDPR